VRLVVPAWGRQYLRMHQLRFRTLQQ
jgi:hypothetical protein